MSAVVSPSLRMVQLGSVLRAIEAGKSLKAEPRPAGQDELGVLKLSAVTLGTFDPNENKRLPPDAEIAGVPTVSKGDLLMSRANTTELVGAVAIPAGNHPNLILSDKTLRLVVDPSQGSPRYLCYALRSPLARHHIESRATGTSGSMRNISQQAIRATPIPLPPLPEQRRIAAILDEADALRRKRREALGLLDELLRSAFLEMFGDPVTNPRGWPVVALGEVLTDIETGWSPVCEGRAAGPGEWGVLKLGAVTSGRFIEYHKALQPDVEPRPALEVRQGDVLFTRKNTAELVAAVAYVHRVRDRLMFPDLVFRLRPNSGRVLPSFLATLLMMPGMRADVQSRAAGSSGSMPGISKSKLVQVVVPMPPLSKQEWFHNWLERHEVQRRYLFEASVTYDGLFDSLLHRAFTGEL